MDAKTEKDNLIEGETGPWEVVIGMEVHAQVTSNAKLFSGASTRSGGRPFSAARARTLSITCWLRQGTLASWRASSLSCQARST